MAKSATPTKKGPKTKTTSESLSAASVHDKEILKKGSSSASSSSSIIGNDANSALEKSLAVFEQFDKDFTSPFQLKSPIVSAITTQSPMLDYLLGIMGYPRGRITQIYGPNGAGKSFLAMLGVASALLADPTAIAIWFDVESSFTYDWARKLKIYDDNPAKSRIKIIKGNKGKEIFERIVGKITKDSMGNCKKTKLGLLDHISNGSLNCPIIVIDSLADIICPREENAPVGGLTVAALPGFLTAEMKRISSIIEATNVSMICINQVRQTLDENELRKNGKYHFPGGENLAHKMSVNILCDKRYRKEDIIYADGTGDDKNSIIGRWVDIVIKKCRFAPTPKFCTIKLIFTESSEYPQIGVGSVVEEYVSLGVILKLIIVNGAWHYCNFDDIEEKFQGFDNTVEFFKNNSDALEKLKKCIAENISKTKIVEKPLGSCDNTESDNPNDLFNSDVGYESAEESMEMVDE